MHEAASSKPILVIAFALSVAAGCAHRSPTLNDGAVPPQAPPPAVAAAPDVPSAPTAETPVKTQDDDFAFLEELQPAPANLVADPLAPYNRAVFYFNDKLYFWVLKPLARGYNAVLPEFVRIGVRNFFSNVTTPIRFVNCLLQGKGTAAGTELGRFALNTTVGVLGFWDPAQTYFDLRMTDEDLGQTFGAYGIGNGIYIVWPVLGSSTLRDSFGFAGDLFLNPISYIDSTAWSVGVGAYRRFNDLSFRLGEYEAIKQAAVEPYEAVRDGYVQFRRALVEE
jgi:phospholipid-binding lipoprotein MlaA